MKNDPFDIAIFSKLASALLSLILIVVFLITGVLTMMLIGPEKISAWISSPPDTETKPINAPSENKNSDMWIAPDTSSIPAGRDGALIRYGRKLIAHTSEYLGPQGTVMNISNGMNCQNCHLEAGTKPFGNNYGAVSSTYPKFRARSGSQESIEKRVNDCLERSLNGEALDSLSHEMRAIVAYINWLGSAVEKGKAPHGSGIIQLPFLDRAASPEKGKIVYQQKCVTCHSMNGEGILASDGKKYIYPPLWGATSYNLGAGLYRLSRFAGYVKANMPMGTTFEAPQLTDEEAWDVAAFVNSMTRPSKDLSKDWPDISKKPYDHPFGPYTDGFDEQQHKFGPFQIIDEKIKVLSKPAK